MARIFFGKSSGKDRDYEDEDVFVVTPVLFVMIIWTCLLVIPIVGLIRLIQYFPGERVPLKVLTGIGLIPGAFPLGLICGSVGISFSRSARRALNA